MDDDARKQALAGLTYGVLAYGFWGVVPAFWKLVRHIPIWEVGGHRIVFGCLAFFVFLAARGRLRELVPILRDRRALLVLATSATLLAVNWLTFIHAVGTDRVLQASLGYFINPLVSVLLGMVFLRERLTRPQWLAVGFAAAGVSYLAIRAGGVPWISLTLAGSFGLYGLIRKTVHVDALPGSWLETVLMLPVGMAYLTYLALDGRGHFGLDLTDSLLLAATGLITALPLWWFANAARRLPLSAIGFLQYLAPTGQFLLAIVVYHEPLSAPRLTAFILIWIGLAVFSADAARRSRRHRSGTHGASRKIVVAR